MASNQPTRTLSKSQFAMYLRTNCDKELYLSLFDKKDMQAAQIPIPLKSRPGVQLLTTSGREFEAEEFDKLINALDTRVVHSARGKNSVDIVRSLNSIGTDSIILQPAIDTENFRDFLLSNLGLGADEKALIPHLSGIKPDAILIRTPADNAYEILPDGTRKSITAGDRRLGISVIDLKNVVEANPSYSAEVCLYAIFLSNWLHSELGSLNQRFYISDLVYLWKNIEMPTLNDVIRKSSGGDIQSRFDALMVDLQEGLVDYMIYMPSVRKFFKEDLLRVIKKGDTDGWHSLPYHVNSKCSACDWLGYYQLLTPSDKKIHDANPNHYCLHAAANSDHLSKLPTISKGAAHVLSLDGMNGVKKIVDIDSGAPVLKKHTLLKKDRNNIGARAKAINTGDYTLEQKNKIGGLAKYRNAEYFIIVNFDSSSGLLTGISIRGFLNYPFEKHIVGTDGQKRTFQVFREESFVVSKNNTQAEWIAVRDFIQKLGVWVATAEKLFDDNDWGKVHTQIVFWEVRQYKELCNAFGRHLIKVLELSERAERALMWIFPAEELMEREALVAPSIIFIKDIVQNFLRLPLPFSTTLLGTAVVYYHASMPSRQVDPYYQEVLGDAIPRERIFEIWHSSTGVIRHYGKDIGIQEAIQKYGAVLEAHVAALASITAQLRVDLKDNLFGKAPVISTADHRGASGVAYDSRLWIQWAKVSAATAIAESVGAFIASVHHLEASYKAIVLTRLLKDLGDQQYEFEVSEESTEAKIDEGDHFCVLGIVDQPGFPIQTAESLGLQPGSSMEIGNFRMKLHKVIKVKILKFDRNNKKATIQLWTNSYLRPVLGQLFLAGKVPIFDRPIFILDGPALDGSKKVIDILSEVGNPVCSKIDEIARRAMGSGAARKIQKGTDEDSPIARVLWNSDALAKTAVRGESEMSAIQSFCDHYKNGRLNESQRNAVNACAKNKLAVVWGPPGTGKTDTLVALIHSLVVESQTAGKSRKILVTGPNYRAVEELSGRLLESLNADPRCVSEVYCVYSQNREPKTIGATAPHLKARSFSLGVGSVSTIDLTDSLQDPHRVTIVATIAHVVDNIRSKAAPSSQNLINELFDLIVIDESSQVELTLALGPLALLKASGQLVVAGDQLQMPPITSLDPPKDAEYLVGSIQKYLIGRFGLDPLPLLVNYRSSQHLVDYAKTLGYPSNLHSNKPAQKLMPIKSIQETIARIPEHLPRTNAYFELLKPSRVVTTLIHEDIVSSQANEFEAKLVAAITYCVRHSMSKRLDIGDGTNFVDEYSDNELFEFGIGIVTPHKAQKALVVRELRTLFPNADPEKILGAVDTVERFQGGERHTIIVSFGVGDTDIIEGEEAFLLQLERTNVAVSRAQAKCIVLMPSALAYHLPSDMKAAKTAKALKSYIEEFCNNKISVTIQSAGSTREGEVRWH